MADFSTPNSSSHSDDDDNNNNNNQLVAQAPDNDNNNNNQVVGRKRRGRPPGSKNKPKQPVIIEPKRFTKIDIPEYCDVKESLIRFARQLQVGIKLEAISGFVSNVHLLRNIEGTRELISSSHSGLFMLHSLCGWYDSSSASTSTSTSIQPSFNVGLYDSNMNVFGGIVQSMMAASDVKVVISTFTTLEESNIIHLPFEKLSWGSPGSSPSLPPSNYIGQVLAEDGSRVFGARHMTVA